jgi:hypothetical protein
VSRTGDPVTDVPIEDSTDRARSDANLASRRSVLTIRQPRVKQSSQNFCVASPLDEVADQLAQQPLATRHSSNHLFAREPRGPIGIIASVIGAVGMALSTFRRYQRLPDQLTTRRLYEQATGADRDRANADLCTRGRSSLAIRGHASRTAR